MVNSKGGFLVDDGKEVDEELQKKEKNLEKQRALQNLEPGAPADTTFSAFMTTPR